MRKGLVVVGIVLLLLGALMLGYGYTATQTSAVPPGACLQITPTSIGSDPVTISWSGGDSSTTVTLYSASSDCSSTTVVASGTGASGSFTATLASGSTYGIETTGSVNVTVANHGLSILELLGALLLVIGVILAVFGARAKPKNRPAPVAAAPSGETGTVAAEGGSEMPAPAAAGTAAGGRPPRVCNYCGTSNDPWLTNCRQCKRPLATTGQ